MMAATATPAQQAAAAGVLPLPLLLLPRGRQWRPMPAPRPPWALLRPDRWQQLRQQEWPVLGPCLLRAASLHAPRLVCHPSRQQVHAAAVPSPLLQRASPPLRHTLRRPRSLLPLAAAQTFLLLRFEQGRSRLQRRATPLPQRQPLLPHKPGCVHRQGAQ